MKTTQAPPGWHRFAEEMTQVAKDRMYFPIEGVYGIMVRDHNSTDKFWFAPSGHYIVFTYEEKFNQIMQKHGHAGESRIRHLLNEWMDEHDPIRVRGH